MKKQRNWTLVVLALLAASWFALSRTVWGPPSRAAANDGVEVQATVDDDSTDDTDARRRYLNNQPRHWRYVMLKRN